MSNANPTESPPEPANIVVEHASNTTQPVELGEKPMILPPVSEVNNTIENSVTIVNVVAESEIGEIIYGDTGQYILPYRSTRGILPKRYSPEKRSKRNTVGHVAKANLTKLAKAIEAALYGEEEIFRTVEEAMEIKHWRDAMMVELKALANMAEVSTTERETSCRMQMGVYDQVTSRWIN